MGLLIILVLSGCKTTPHKHHPGCLYDPNATYSNEHDKSMDKWINLNLVERY